MTTRVSVVGPAVGALQTLTTALGHALADPTVRQILYLGDDGAASEVVEGFLSSGISADEFLQRGSEVALHGDAAQVDALLAAEAWGRRLAAVRCLPPPPTRAVELLDRWILLAVYDKAVLDEDDIANAHVILYGRSSEATIKRFGQRLFFSPGPLSAGHVGVLALEDDGSLVVEVRDLQGEVQQRESLQAGAAKLVVTP